MNIVEIFYSLQGEGRLAGVPSVFVRVAGCTVQCSWCDTKFAWDESAGEDLSIDDILSRVEELGQNQQIQIPSPKFVVVTGGEPMTNEHLPLLLARLAHSDFHITVETAGIHFIEDLPVDLMSVSPKLSNIGHTAHSSAAILRKFVKQYDYQLKFVIDAGEDIEEVRALVETVKEIDPQKVMLMPQAKTREELIAKAPMVADLCTQYGYTFCQRLQVLLWDNYRGK